MIACRSPFHRPDLPVLRQHRAGPSRRKPVCRLSALSPGSARDAAEGVAVPINSADLLGLHGVQLPLTPAIEQAYEELKDTPLEDGYSELARLGKEKILSAARQELHRVGGRTALLRPGVQIEQLLLPGAMALLHQVRRYDLVVQLSEEGAGLGASQIQGSSPHTLREMQQDMALATALAQCGLADRCLKEGQPAEACSRLEGALELLVSAPHATSSGGSSMAQQQGGGSGGGSVRHQAAQQQGQQRVLAPRLQAEIRQALAQYHPDAVADYLQVPLDRADYSLRQKELQALREWAAAPAPRPRWLPRWVTGKRQQRPPLTADYMARIVPHLTAAELCSLFDWQRLAAAGSSSRCPWYFAGLLKRVALAHLVSGFLDCSPSTIQTALQLFSAIKKGDDVALPLALCALLLGDPASSLELLQEDERTQAATQQQQHIQQQAGVAGSNGAFEQSGRGVGPGARHAVMPFIRQQSPQGEADLRPGLAAFASWWLEAVAYPEFQDTAQGAASRPDLSAYFGSPAVRVFLASQQIGMKPSGGMLGALLGRSGSSASFEQPPHGSAQQLQRAGGLLTVMLRLVAGAALVAASVLAVSRLRSGGWDHSAWLLQRMPAAAERMPPDETTEAAAADIGLPAQALRRLWPQQRQQEQEHRQAAEPSRPPQQQQQQQMQQQPQQKVKPQKPAALPPQQQQQQERERQQQIRVPSKSAAAKLVKEWLKVKADAMGPRHMVAQLSQVLAEPMLSAVVAEAVNAAAGGWYWDIRPLQSKVDSVDASSFNAADGSGRVAVRATVHESAELWGAGGEQGEGYTTTYQVEYTIVHSGGGWKIASAVVLSS